IDLKYDEKLNNDNIKKFSNFIYSLTSDLKIKIDKTGIQKLLEEALILNESKEKFSLVISDIKAILEEAVLLANESKKKIIKEKEIEKALEFIKYRFGHPRRRYFEALKQKIFRIDLSGSRVGRINGLSIFTPFISFQEYGQISTISARVNMGGGSLINIEREVNFSGDLHDRGVFVLQSYLKGLFHKFQSLGMDISILFEQNHSIIDGDSASVAELIAVFSAISELPIPSNIAITGSLTQYGESLPVGAVIQKIESFFEITKLIGSQKETYKVFLPEQNIRDLILSKELRKYIEKGKFQIIAFSNVEEVVEEVFSIPFGKIGKNGKYQEGSFLKRIEEKLEKR
ncbi:MAG: AAA family ATPase, partial [Leptospiraceae bacterium]|nr:AAA family ATPase [Leptospiraceae bacterium]